MLVIQYSGYHTSIWDPFSATKSSPCGLVSDMRSQLQLQLQLHSLPNVHLLILCPKDRGLDSLLKKDFYSLAWCCLRPCYL